MNKVMYLFLLIITSTNLIYSLSCNQDPKVFYGKGTAQDKNQNKALDLAKTRALAEMTQNIKTGVFALIESYESATKDSVKEELNTQIIVLSRARIVNHVYTIIKESKENDLFYYEVSCQKYKVDYYNECLRNPDFIDEEEILTNLLNREIQKLNKEK